MLDNRISRSELYAVAAVIFLAVVFACVGFGTRPALWYDEGVTIQLARNFMLYGVLDTQVSPHAFSGAAYVVGTNGFPVTLPLAFIYKIFGFGFEQGRMYMLMWFVAAQVAIYGVMRLLFDRSVALAALVAVSSFASVYADGLTVTGEVPGLVFFFIGILILLRTGRYFPLGIAWGLAMASKPGVFLVLAHTVVLYVLIADRQGWWKKVIAAGVGMSVPIALWIILAFPHDLDTIFSLVAYALNPIDIPVITSLIHTVPVHVLNEGVVVPQTNASIGSNLALFVTNPTLIYFSILGIFVCIGLWPNKASSTLERRFFILFISYGVFTLAYFVRGPGWLRYLLALQILTLVLLYPALRRLIRRIHDRAFAERPAVYHPAYAIIAMVCIISLQIVHLLTFSDIPRSGSALDTISYVRELMRVDPAATIGTYDVPEITAFTDPGRTFDISRPQLGYRQLGESPLLMPLLPSIIVRNRNGPALSEAELRVLAASYDHSDMLARYEIYTRNLDRVHAVKRQ